MRMKRYQPEQEPEPRRFRPPYDGMPVSDFIDFFKEFQRDLDFQRPMVMEIAKQYGDIEKLKQWVTDRLQEALIAQSQEVLSVLKIQKYANGEAEFIWQQQVEVIYPSKNYPGKKAQ